MSRNNSDYINEYMKKNYYSICLSLKYAKDGEIIDWLNEQREWGYSYNEIARTALREYFEEEKRNRHA